MMTDGRIKILAELDEFVVLEKASGFLSVKGKGPENEDCVVTRFCTLYPEAPAFPAVHRLDMDTSGIIICARTKEAHRHLSLQFQNRNVSKEYEALLDGLITTDAGTITLPFRLDIDNRPRQIYDPIHGKIGITDYTVLAQENNQTRILFRPLTGRTHQLRVHSAHPCGLGCPIVGDRLYGTETVPGKLCLHARAITVMNPKTKEMMTFRSTVPF